jgi:HPt (histidine-containing phosphotransfer) domain-containing protein
MTRSFLYRGSYWGTLALCSALSCSTSFARNPAAQTAQSAGAAPATTPSQPQTGATTPPTEAKKTKKVWTNDDVASLSGPVSVVGSAKNNGTPGLVAKADPQFIANTRKQLEKLRSQLDDTDKQLADLQDFSGGKSASTSGGYQINKGYNRVPVDQQITNLEAKKEQLQGKIDALLDEARKKGVQPGDLR